MEDKFSALSVLILEDHSFQRMVAEQTVSGLGIHHLTTAKDAEQALEQLKVSGAVDIVICDLDMPGMDGIQFIRHLGEQKLAHSLIVLSALDASLIRIVGGMAQAHGLKVLGNLPKPLSRDRIRELMELHFGEKPEEGRAIVTNELIFDEEDLKQAINDQQFILYYQPKVLLQSGRLVSFEALARWLHPEAGLISPTHFIPLMESTGLITTMTLNLIDIALEQIHTWRSRGR
ncbi:MAG: EAL domain-containing protein, partial [Endozoicomonas sp.]